jgi:hypothetical protein
MRAGDAARAAAWVAAIGLVARHTVGTWQLARTLAWLHADERAENAPLEPVHMRRMPQVHVIIPVLREQQHVEAALAWWREILHALPGMTLTIVSTDREERERDQLAAAVSHARHLTRTAFPQISPSELAELNRVRVAAGGRLTREAAAAILARTPLTREVVTQLLVVHDPARIRHVTYLGPGRKAAQINYAAKSLPGGGYLAVYDVDSRPDVELLAGTCALLTHQPYGPTPPVVQQHALHIVSPAAGRAVERALVRGSATLQSTWTLRREIPYARRYQKSAGKAGVLTWLRAGVSQPVGHGLFVRQDVLAELGGLPENSVLDDVPAGVPLTLCGIPTVSLPRLTTVPAPESVAEIIAQGRRWFCSYLDYPAVLREAGRAGVGSPLRRTLVYGVAGYRGAAWLAAGPLTALTIAAVLAPKSGWRLRATASAGVLQATVVPIVMTTAERAAVDRVPLVIRQVGRDSTELLGAYLLRSAGPWLAIADALRGRHPTSAAAPAPKAHRRREGAAP